MNEDFFNSFQSSLESQPVDNLDFLFKSFLNKIDTAMPVKVIEVKPGAVGPVGKVTIQPLVSQVQASGEQMPLAPIPNVPYFRSQGGKNAVIIDPEVGDIGFVVCCSRDISSVKRAKQMTPPASFRMHSLSDALYVGGILNGAPVQYIQFRQDGIVIHSPKKVIVEAAEKVVMDTPLVEILGRLTMTGEKGSGAQTSGGISNTGGTIESNGVTLETHVHKGVTPGSGNTGEPA